MPRSALLFVVIGILLAAACHKSEPNAQPNRQPTTLPIYPDSIPPVNLELLQGQWLWIEQTRSPAVFGPPDTTYIATSLGITEFLDMNKDSTWSVISNGQTTKSGTYKIDTLPSPDGLIPMLALVYNGKDSLLDHWFSSDNDTLYTAVPQVGPSYIQDTYVRFTGL
jgi:hypothetical protein